MLLEGMHASSKAFIVLEEFTAGNDLDVAIGSWAVLLKELKSPKVFVLNDGCFWGVIIEYWDRALDARTGDGDWDDSIELEASSASSLPLLRSKDKI